MGSLQQVILDVGRLMSGYFFIWPGVWQDVKMCCKHCPRCQRAAPNTNPRAPPMSLPCVPHPFQKVAMDIVGPLPRTSGGHKFV